MNRLEIQKKIKDFSSASDALKSQIEDQKKELSLINKEIYQLKDSIKRDDLDIQVTDHAVLRFFERVLGFDLIEIRNQILTNEIISMVKNLGGTGKFPATNLDGFKIVMVDYVITTIIPDSKRIEKK